jgi:FxsC-like protein
LPPLATTPALADVRSEWSVAGGQVPRPHATGPKHVRFIYLALDPASIGHSRSTEPYLDAGGVDWKPFYPDTTPIHLFAQKVVASDELAFTSDAVPFGADLLDQIRQAWDARQIVVLVVDPWSLHWDAQALRRGYQTLLNELDKQNAFHWCVLLPWNEQDAELGGVNRPAIETIVAQTFPFHGGLTKNPMFYRDAIKSFVELKAVLGEVLARLKEEIRRQAEVTMPLPAGPSKVVMVTPTKQGR